MQRMAIAARLLRANELIEPTGIIRERQKWVPFATKQKTSVVAFEIDVSQNAAPQNIEAA